MLFETNLSVNGLAQKADMEHSNIARFLSEKFIPTDATILKLATALCVNETAIVDPNCENVVINPIFVIGNLKAIIEHSGMATSTYIVRHLKLDDRNMQKVLLNGNITSTQAHRIVEAEGGAFSLRQLVCEDLTAKFPPAPKLDAAVVQRNLCSVGWERGLYSAEIARKSGISFTTAMNYAAGRSKRIGRPLLTKIADSLEMPVAELVDPLRPVTELTPFFKSNVQFLLDQSGLAPTAFAEQCSLELRALRLLIDGSDPNPHQVAKLCANLKRTPLEVLTKDLRASTKTGTDGGPEVAPVSAPDPNNQ
jgi:transcriptional regulator with XRE-family HTH domain